MRADKRAGKIGLVISIALLATMAVQRAGAQAAGENLFKNPGFESSQDWWQFDHSFGTATGTISFDDPLAVHAGAKGAKLVVTAVDGENWHIQLQCPPQFEAAKDFDYRLSFWGRTNSMDGKTIHVAIQDGAPDYAYRAGQDFRLDTAWQQIEKLWTSDMEGLEMLRFNIYLGSDTGTYYLDDFALTAAPVPTGLRNPQRSSGTSLNKTVAIPVVDATGRSVGIGRTHRHSPVQILPRE
ncbi:MAG: carbohydrate binding domain-containing protein [Fibrobacteria bacterium]